MNPWIYLVLVLVLLYGYGGVCRAEAGPYELPPPDTRGGAALVECMAQRRSVREFVSEELSLQDLGQILWAAAGQVDTVSGATHTRPSAGATMPLEVWVVVGQVEGLPAGVYQYQAEGHLLHPQQMGDRRGEVAQASLGQMWMAEAPVQVIFAAREQRTLRRYGDRGWRYIAMEAGHAGQNLYLQVQALNLGTCAVGAFADDLLAEILGSTDSMWYIFPIGKPR